MKELFVSFKIKLRHKKRNITPNKTISQHTNNQYITITKQHNTNR